MRRLPILATGLPAVMLAGCAVLGPQSEPSWTDARIADDRGRPAPHYVPEIPRPVAQSWMMSAHARALADTRDVMINVRDLLELPQPEALEFGQQARERATPPPPPVRD
ncbi:MAG: hypothetical protein JJU26_03935 [Oceanicaulis sp.]|uniref:hypothetical protein n=1 Tax=Glycocaulis sp. TaxID=1969725 RepID=UPI0025BCA2E8|nr:hypothetical protein [Glycocaulis sp.]MCC5980852.1 hypothetical protein [Oceanicaulis sp.]MCH8521076.1 hypothetical protein [Glycocaulis sp.]